MTPKRTKPEQNSVDFESSMAELQTIAKALEDDNMSLEDAMKAFERGIKITREAQITLSKAEQRVQLLLEEDGQPASSELPVTEDDL
jgi:exodeoxyribonuclease VII small subunit